ncbi:LamG domain-containing protein [Pseudarthrobacter sp. NIBRBAC000502770]|uniref:LamG domain-containing protein n=1 Tax=Pseudarthrobacter sp. NIBRBAC000502770 TaxID=2590785 RepID=UPI0011403E3C|nr:LamG domain-containing protein [Pseudarthrobacter sp. NIBRBAC000502770]QDG90691.1 LamG domain-containing protein [Pseudarthrobacter sp. NIBRBAC000502770]
MTDYLYDLDICFDPDNPNNIVRGGLIEVYDATDLEGTTLLALKDTSGNPISNPMTSNEYGVIGRRIAPVPQCLWKSGAFSGVFNSYKGLRDEAIAARGAAEAAASEANQSALAAAASAELALGPTDEQIEDRIERADIPGQVATAVAVNPDVAAAAAAAVTNALVQKNLSITLVERPAPATPASAPLTVFSGTPTYVAGKFGNAEKGATLTLPPFTDQSGDYTIEFWFNLATAPGFNKVLLDVPGFYLGLGAAGQLYLTDPAAVTGPNICNGVWHHIAVGYRRVAATSRVITGVWVDGTRIVAQGASAAQSAWYNWSIGGFHASAGSEARNVIFDDLRVSFGTEARYTTDTFATPSTAATLDASAILLAPLDSLAATKPGSPGAMGYETRPATAPAGMVTYVGLTTPTDMLNRDRWIKA